MRYQIIVKPSARKAIENVQSEYKDRAYKAIDTLATDPFIGKPLHGPRAGQLSYRVGAYRIIYEIFKKKLIIVIIEFGARSGVY